jgi:predicted MFS family arabinose efflux permease
LAFCTLLVVGTDLFVVSPLLPDLAHEYGTTPGAAGSTVTVFSIAYMVAAPFSGSLADRLGRRTVLAAGLSCFGVANLLTAAAPTFSVLLVARAVAGIAASSITPSVLALVGQSAPSDRRASWMSTAMAGFLISLTTGAPSGTAAAAALGWRSAFVGIGVLAVALAPVNWLAWRGVETAAPLAHGVGEDRLGLPTRIRAVSVTGIWALSVYAFYTYLGTVLSQDAGFSASLIATALVVYGVGAVLGTLAGGRLADRFGAGRIVGLSLLALAGAQLLVGSLLHAPSALLIVALALFALAAYPCLPAYQSRLVTRFGRQSGSVLAWNSSFMYLGTSVGAALGGAVLSRWGFFWITVIGAVVALGGVFANHTLPNADFHGGVTKPPSIED